MSHVYQRYRTLLEVSNVLNSQREMDSLWQACTELIKDVVPWERAGVLLYVQEEDGKVRDDGPSAITHRGGLQVLARASRLARRGIDR